MGSLFRLFIQATHSGYLFMLLIHYLTQKQDQPESKVKKQMLVIPQN